MDFGLGFGSTKIGNFLTLDGIRNGRFLDSPEFEPYHDTGNFGFGITEPAFHSPCLNGDGQPVDDTSLTDPSQRAGAGYHGVQLII